MTSTHYNNDRQYRENLIRFTIGYGHTIGRFHVDKGHPNGAEIHEVSSTGIITVFNERTNKLVTRMVARPNQIYRYFDSVHKEAPKAVIALARYHQQMGWNN